MRRMTSKMNSASYELSGVVDSITSNNMMNGFVLHGAMNRIQKFKNYIYNKSKMFIALKKLRHVSLSSFIINLRDPRTFPHFPVYTLGNFLGAQCKTQSGRVEGSENIFFKRC